MLTYTYNGTSHLCLITKVIIYSLNGKKVIEDYTAFSLSFDIEFFDPQSAALLRYRLIFSPSSKVK